MSKAQDDDDLVMRLVQVTLEQAPDQRESHLRDACGDDAELFAEVWNYVEWEIRMQGFLLDPLCAPPPVHQLQPGELLESRFRIVREVAQGGMGIVYEAFDEKLHKRIALKCAKAGFRDRLFPEVRHASEISHPNVCRIFEIHAAETPQGQLDFITMEFLDGETLTARLKRGKIPEAETRAIAIQICQGLAEAHRKHVIHGDLKSNNVILTQADAGGIRAVITDFGLALGTTAPVEDGALSGSTEPGGTPDYMAPELWKGGKATTASDVYALGVILYELATGQRPFTSPSGKPGATRKLPPAHSKWDSILARCLDPDPAKRFPDSTQVAQALEPSRAWRWWLAAAAAVALAAGVGAYSRTNSPQETIKLAFTPFQAGPEDAARAVGVSQDVSRELAHLKGGGHVRVTVVKSPTAPEATHVLHGTLSTAAGPILIHAILTDTRSKADIADWEFAYSPDELRYAPRAVASIATAALHLPAFEAPPVNAAAQKDYEAGLADSRRNSTIDQALSTLDRAVKEDSDSPVAWAALAEAQYSKYFITKDKIWLDRTWASLQQAQRRDLDLSQVHRVAGLVLFSSGFYEPALADYLRAIELDPASGLNQWRLSQVYENTNRLDLALIALQKAVQLEPNYFKMYLQLGAYYYKHGDLTKSIEQFKTCVKLAPDEPETHFALGAAFLNKGLLDDAEQEMRQSIRLGGPAQASNNLGNLLMIKGKDGDAIPFLKGALQQSEFGDRYLWWMNLGDAYRRTRKRDLSLSAYRNGLEAADKVLSRNSRDGSVRSYLAYLSARLGDRSRAESEMAQSLTSAQDNDTKEMAVTTLEALGERDRALAILKNLPDDALEDAARLPNLADLWQDSRFIDLLRSRHLVELLRSHDIQ